MAMHGAVRRTTQYLLLLVLFFFASARQGCSPAYAKDGTGLDKITWSGTIRIERESHSTTDERRWNGTTTGNTEQHVVTEYQVEALPYDQNLSWNGNVRIHARGIDNSYFKDTLEAGRHEECFSQRKTEGDGSTTGYVMVVLRGQGGSDAGHCWLEAGGIGQRDDSGPLTKPIPLRGTEHYWGVCNSTPTDSTKTIDQAVNWDDLRIEVPCEKDARALHGSTVQTTSGIVRHISWDLTQDGEARTEVEIVPPAAYEQWVPQAGENEKTLGNFMDVGIVAHTKGDPSLKPPKKVLKYKITLFETSRERGVDLNWPPYSQATEDYDMKIDADNPWIKVADEKGQSAETKQEGLTEFSVTINSYDWGGYTKLKVVAELEDGTSVVAHVRGHNDQEFLSIPKDDNQNHIADYWEHWFSIKNTDQWADDDDTPEGDGHKGDSIPLYEEYRGFHIHGKHERLSPELKDLFIWDVDNLGGGLYAQATNVTVHLIYGSERATRGDFPNHNVVDPNGLRDEVFALQVIDGPLDDGGVGDTDGGPSVPRNIRKITINSSLIKSGYKKDVSGVALQSTIAHEIAHGTNVKHHGERPPDYDTGDVRCKLPDGSFENHLCSAVPKGKNVKPGTLKQQAGDCFSVAGKGGSFSGNDQCVMRYDMTDLYENPNGNCQWQHNGKTVFGYKYGSDPPGTTMCSSGRGTGVNDPSNPNNKAGDASPGRGDCMHKFCLKNSAH